MISDMFVMFWLFTLAHQGQSVGAAKNKPIEPPLVVPGDASSPFDKMTTVSPSVKLKVNYTVGLTSNSPAVLDSTLVFAASLSKSSISASVSNSTFDALSLDIFRKLYLDTFENSLVPIHKMKSCVPGNVTEKEYIYMWLHTVDENYDQCLGSTEVMLLKTFSGNKVTDGNYVMMVIVKPVEQPNEILAFHGIIFQLTKNLNGNLNISQTLDYQRNSTIFAIAEEIIFSVNLTDTFLQGLSPFVVFTWYNGSEVLMKTQRPVYSGSFSHPGVLSLEVQVVASFQNAVPQKNKTLKQQLFLKEKLSDCNVTRVDSHTDDRSVILGNAVILSIKCNGSAPSAVCLNVTKSDVTFNETCKPPTVFQNTTVHNVTIYFDSIGWSCVHLAVYNDLSVQLLQQEIYVYNADSVNIPALVVPAVFISIGIVIVLVWTAYTVRLRRRLHRVEVADFDFNPSIAARSSCTTFAHLARSFKILLLRWMRRYSYSSVNTDDRDLNRCHSVYDSL